ncbi:hypothetical protein QC760_10803 [Botrytis cinerea]
MDGFDRVSRVYRFSCLWRKSRNPKALPCYILTPKKHIRNSPPARIIERSETSKGRQKQSQKASIHPSIHRSFSQHSARTPLGTPRRSMDPAFVPSEIAVRHIVHHKFTIEIGPSVQSLGKPIRNLMLTLVGIYCVANIVQSTLQSVFSLSRSRNEED